MSGYFRFPTIHKQNIIFVSEDDLWIVDINNLIARRLTANYGPVTSPTISPDGKSIAYIGQEDGNTELYTMPISGGVSKRITHEGGYISNIACWKNDKIYYSSSLDSPFGRLLDLRYINSTGGESHGMGLGMTRNISYSGKNIVIGKNTSDIARWKRYKGGTAGKLLVNIGDSKDEFKYLVNINGNLACPMYIKDRIYFVSDHEGVGNIYSCLKTGSKLVKHTDHRNYFARNATTDNENIVYHCGGDIYIFNVESNQAKKVNIKYNSPKTQISRKYVSADSYLERFTFNNDLSHLNVITRGKCFTMGNWDGPVLQHGQHAGIRYNHPTVTKNGKNLLLTSDYNNSDCLEIHSLGQNRMIKRMKSKTGRVLSIKRSPCKDLFGFINHKHELSIINIKEDKVIKIDRSKNSPLSFNWSPCGNFIAYSCSNNHKCRIIKIYDVKNNKKYTVTDGVATDSSPIFDPKGKYLAFLSNRNFNPIYDSIQFDLGFPMADKPYIILLSKNTNTPFIKDPTVKPKIKDDKTKKKSKIKTVIDFDGIKNRIIGLPVNASILGTSIGFNDNKLYYISWPLPQGENRNIKGTVKYFDLIKLEEKTFMSNIVNFNIYNDKIALYDSKHIRLLKLGNTPSKDILQSIKYNSDSGLINLSRIKVIINAIDEWKQMYSEAWRLQRDHFWVSNMSNINWKKIYTRYFKLIDKLGSRSEFSDLIWEMQGELGTSHCYEMGGDYKQTRKYNDGMLGANIKYSIKDKLYKIKNLYKGDLWQNPQSPLLAPGLNINVGDFIEKINGIKLTAKSTPGYVLVNQYNNEINLTIISNKDRKRRHVTVRTIGNDKHLKYRDWVEKNRSYVHRKSNNKIGYIHIPDMGVEGYAEFHRYFLTEISYDGLIVDVRYNGGGHISQLLLSKLARKRIGYDLTRWMGEEPYPMESPAGPMVAITNEFAGSDGDIFSHSWKLLKLGKLIGKRTWGGVIGIWPRNSLVDGTLTSQPEFSFWFKDVGWNVENYGTDVDIEIENLPQDNLKNLDNQLDKSIEVVLSDIKKDKSLLIPDFSNKPNLKLP